MNSVLIPFPQEWFKFSEHQEIVWCDDYGKVFYPEIPFLYEAAFFHGLETLKPWKMSDDTVPVILQEWETVRVELHEKFSKRELKATIQPMKKGIGLFFETLYWCNQYPATIQNKDDSKLKIKPVNLEERLHFILSYPNKYHAYIQLTELFIEIEKLFRKQQVIKKSSKA